MIHQTILQQNFGCVGMLLAAAASALQEKLHQEAARKMAALRSSKQVPARALCWVQSKG
jgi:hypothetical protein